MTLLQRVVLPSLISGLLGLTNPVVASEQARDATPDVEEELTDESPIPTFEDLFRISSVHHAVMSPNGQFSAYVSYLKVLAGNADVGFFVVETSGGTGRFIDLEWVANDMLVATTANQQSGAWGLHVVQVGVVDGEMQQLRHTYHEVDGFIYDRLEDEPEHVILGKYLRRNGKVVADLFHFNLFGDAYLQTKNRHRLVKDTDELLNFLQDANGDFFLGTSMSGSKPVIWRKRGTGRGKWSVVWTGPEDTEFTPVGLSADERTLWALSDVVTDKVAAVAFDLETLQIDEVLFEHPRFDLATILFDDARAEPIGVSYMETGLFRYRYFNSEDQRTFDTLRTLLPGNSVIITGYSEDRNRFLVYATSPQDPGSLYTCDLPANSCSLIAPTKPWLSKKILAESAALTVTSEDGLVIEAFVTMPPDLTGPMPLITMPHGGPIGISDDQYFSPDVQWLALNGYAVLQVNYRGSGGYGKEFLSAGLREWGRGIEADVRAAIAATLEAYPQIDPDRIGIYGGSYGGYSALVSVIENPELFKCAASFAGVTDLTLLFNRSGLRQNQSMTERLIQMIGDPDVNYEELARYSPVYQYRNISRPIFIAHGNNDTIVDVEHSWRLRTMLNLVGVRPEFLILEDVGHGFEYVKEAWTLYEPLVNFLDKHLKPDSGDELADDASASPDVAAAQ